MEKCVTTMGCGHICPKICHANNDREHTEFKCKENCTRFCPVGHPCPKKCFVDCKPCMVQVTKKLPCTHEQIVYCYKDLAKEFCQTPVWKVNCISRLLLDHLLWNNGNVCRFYHLVAMELIYCVERPFPKLYVPNLAELPSIVAIFVLFLATKGAPMQT